MFPSNCIWLCGSLQITDGCAGYMLGDKVFIYTLTVNDFTDTTQGDYAISFSNVGGEASVPSTRVTERGEGEFLYLYYCKNGTLTYIQFRLIVLRYFLSHIGQ